MPLRPETYEERREAQRKADAWRRRSARKYERNRERKPMKKRADGSHDEYARVFLSKTRVRFVNAMGCRVSGCRRTKIENAHIGSGGTGRKLHYSEIVPLCDVHHDELDGRRPIADGHLPRIVKGGCDDVTRLRFERLYEMDMAEEARKTDEAWAEAWAR